MKPSKYSTLILCLITLLATDRIVCAETFSESEKEDILNVMTEDFKKELLDLSKKRKKIAMAINNAKSIGLAMFEFENEYGEFPNEKTAAVVKELTKNKFEIKGETSNDCFYQLIAAGLTKQNIFSFEEPSEQNVGEANLEVCSYSYLSGMTSAGNPARPLVVAPLIKGKAIFDPEPFAGKAVVLFVDCSVRCLPIESDGRVLIGGKDLFDISQPYWEGRVPTLKWPKN
jgi:hypothetical protein